MNDNADAEIALVQMRDGTVREILCVGSVAFAMRDAISRAKLVDDFGRVLNDLH
jgi:hypothetical protein